MTDDREPLAGWNALKRGLPEGDVMDGKAPRAQWMHPADLRSPEWTWQEGKIVLGGALRKAGEPEYLIGQHDNRHLMTIAGSRAGKGTSAIIPNLLTYTGSVLVIDPKGENAEHSAKRRAAMGQDVYIIDPFGVADVPDEYRAGFNPLADLSPVDENFIDDCDAIADALIVAETGKENDHWNSSARDVLRGFIAWVIANPEGQTRSLNEVRRVLAGLGDDPDDESDMTAMERICAAMIDHEHIAGGIPAEIGARILGMGENESGSILSTVATNIAFIGTPAMERCLSATGRMPDLRRWKYGSVSIYLCLPAGKLHRYFRFFRLVLNRLLQVIEGDEGNTQTPALLILDEMHILGHMATLEKSAALVAGFGVKIWSIWQDINQLKRYYSETWETFIGNCGLIQVFGLNDQTTLEYISKRLGNTYVMNFSKQEIEDFKKAMQVPSDSFSLNSAPLLDTHEIAQHFERDGFYQLLIPAGKPPVYARRIPYYTDIYQPYRQ